MTEVKMGAAVTRQATDDSPMNTEPAIVAGAVVGIVGAVGSILVIGGYIDADQKRQLEGAAGQIVPAVFVIAAIAQAVWTRMHVYAPRTAAKIALANARQPSDSVAVLTTPP